MEEDQFTDDSWSADFEVDKAETDVTNVKTDVTTNEKNIGEKEPKKVQHSKPEQVKQNSQQKTKKIETKKSKLSSDVTVAKEVPAEKKQKKESHIKNTPESHIKTHQESHKSNAPPPVSSSILVASSEKAGWSNVNNLGNLNLWRFAAGVLAVVLVISLFTNGFNFNSSSVKGKLSKEAAVQQVLAYLNGLQPGLDATAQSSIDVGDLYQIQLSVAGQPFDSYITKDGRLLFPQGIELSSQLTAPGTSPAAQQNSPNSLNSPNSPSTLIDVSADDDPVKGDANAPVTIIEFSDFQCPFCARFFTETLSQIETNYIKTGKVKLVYRDFPLENIHINARSAALAAECADDQGKFWEMHDKLFANQDELGDASYKTWAAELGLDKNKFDECLTSKKYDTEITKDFTDGSAAGVSGTPSFFINGRELSGAQPFEAFKEIIDAELAQLQLAEQGAESENTNLGNANSNTNSGTAPTETTPTTTPSEAPTPSTSSDVKEIKMIAKKYRFDPDTIQVQQGQRVRLLVTSIDVEHGFALPDFNINVDLKPGETKTIEFTADKKGTFEFVCSVFCGTGHKLMKGQIVVK